MMFEYASTYGVSQTLCRKPFLLGTASMFRPAEVFANLKIPYEVDGFYNVTMKESGCVKFTEGFLDIPCRGDGVRLSIYLQSWRYFEESFADLKSHFIFKAELERDCLEVLQKERTYANTKGPVVIVGG